MELYIYDLHMTLLGIVDEITALVWTRRYWDSGTFSLLLPMTARHGELLQIGRIVARRNCDEAAQIRYLNIKKDAQGLEQIEVQGQFLTHWIGKRLLLAPLSATMPTHELLETIVRENVVAPTDEKRTIPGVEIGSMPGLVTETLSCFCPAYQNALEVCSDRAKLAKIGFKIATDTKIGKHIFQVYKGLDRTTGQSQNTVAIFSPDFDNVLSQEFTRSVENVATAIFVGGAESEGLERMVAEVSGGESGLERIEYFDDSFDIDRYGTGEDSETPIPEEEYLELLRSRGRQVLDQKTEHVAFASLIDTNASLRYRRNYDVGDRVTCINQRWKVQIESRITEITESYESGRMELDITFGVSIPSIRDALKWR